jgi:hypothetical protein
MQRIVDFSCRLMQIRREKAKLAVLRDIERENKELRYYNILWVKNLR